MLVLTSHLNTSITLAAHLHPGLGQSDPHGELLPHEDVWVVSLAKASLQLVELARCEPRSVTFLFGVFVLDSEDVLVLALAVLVLNVEPEAVALLRSVLVTVPTVACHGVNVGFGFPDLTALAN